MRAVVDANPLSGNNVVKKQEENITSVGSRYIYMHEDNTSLLEARN